MRDPETNSPWDLSKKDVQNRVRKMVTVSKPFMLVGSPPCTPFSRLQALNSPNREPKIVEEELAAGRAHVIFCFEMYELQRTSGRFFASQHGHFVELAFGARDVAEGGRRFGWGRHV